MPEPLYHGLAVRACYQHAAAGKQTELINEGIDITTVPTVGCNSYSNDINRGVGLITLNENDLTTYQYEALRMYDFALAEGSKIPECDGALSTFEYAFYKVIDQFLEILHKMASVFSFIK